MNSKIKQELIQKFDNMFQKSSLKNNTYLFNQMKPNLQIPLSVIFKERRILNISTDQKLIIEALKTCDKVKVNEQKKNIQLKIKPSKTKLVVQKIVDEKSSSLNLEKILNLQLPNEQYRIEFEKSNNSLNINFSDEVSANKIFIILQTDPFFKTNSIYLTEGNVFNQIKQAVEKLKKLKKEKGYQQSNQVPYGIQNNTFDFNNFYNYGNQLPFNFNNPNQLNCSSYYYQDPFLEQRPRGPGFIRKAIQSQQQQQQDKKPKYKTKQQTVTTAEIIQNPKKQIQKRIRLNSQNFPSLNDIQKKIQEKCIKYKYNKKQIVQIFSKMNGQIHISKELQSSNIPVINTEGNFKLQVMKKGGRKSSTFDSPQTNFQAFRKSST